jgi:hypothetical protein
VATTGKSSAATSGKVVATVKAADASLRTAKPAATPSTSEAAAAHATAVEATTSTTVHPTATTTVTATTASHCWRSNRESESCRSNQFEISHSILSFFGEKRFSPSLEEVLTIFTVPNAVSHYRAPLRCRLSGR